LRTRWEWDPLRNDLRFQKILAGPEPKLHFRMNSWHGTLHRHPSNHSEERGGLISFRSLLPYFFLSGARESIGTAANCKVVF
jgi:hypothetical protein